LTTVSHHPGFAADTKREFSEERAETMFTSYHGFSPTWITRLALTVAIAVLLGSTVEAADSMGIDVRDFGAVGDGEHDDSAAIQRAVDSGSHRIRFAPGSYRITRPIQIDLQKVGYTAMTGGGVAQLVMAGPGPALQFVGTHFSSADPARINDPVWDRERMPCVDGLAIRGEHAKAIGIEARGTMQITLTRLHLRGLLHGIHLTENNRNVIISDCHIYENRGIGIFYDQVNLHQSNITGAHISYNGGGGIVSRGGNVRNIQITGCDLESNMSKNEGPTANVLIDCAASNWGTAEVAITGCTIQHNHDAADSANIRIVGNTRRPQQSKITREGLVTISGNVLSDVYVNIHLQHCRGVVVTGNTAWRAYQHNLLAEDCEAIVVGSNNFARRNPHRPQEEMQAVPNRLLFRNCRDSVINGLLITDVTAPHAGITLTNCSRMNVANCSILDCDHVGLLLEDVTHSRVSGCLIQQTAEDNQPSASIRVIRGSDNHIQER
jgi:hypothetical protein